MKLISMTDFVAIQNNTTDTSCEYGKMAFLRCVRYAEFLRQPLTLGMFVPVDEQGKVLKEPTQEKYGWYSASSHEEQSGWMYEEGEAKYYDALKQWQEAKEKVLFEGFELRENMITDGMNDVYFMSSNGKFSKHCLMGNDIEYMVYWDLELTPSALKQIGL